MGLLKRAWDYSGWIVGGYTLYKQLQSLQEAKNDFYSSLSPEQQTQWKSIFGDPGIAHAVQSPSLPPVAVKSPNAVTPLTQLKAGT